MLPRSIFILVLTACVACSPLVPLHHPRERLDNPPVLFESNEIKISLRFLERKYGHNVFVLDVTNQLENDILFAPKAISMFASSKPFSFPVGTENLDSISVANSKIIPTRVFARSKHEVSQLTQRAAEGRAALGVFFAILTVGAIIYDNAQDNEDDNKEYFTKRDAEKANTRDALVVAGRLSTDIAFSSANNALDYSYAVTNEVFSEGNIWAGKSKQGLIFIPNPTTYRYTRVIIPINETDYVFDFRLRGRKPPR